MLVRFDHVASIIVNVNRRIIEWHESHSPMTDDDFDLLIGTLNLWKKKLIAPKSEPDAKSETSKADDED